MKECRANLTGRKNLTAGFRPGSVLVGSGW